MLRGQVLRFPFFNHTEEKDIRGAIAALKADGRESEISGLYEQIKNRVLTDIPQSLAYVQGHLFEVYINDMKILQKFTMFNRKAIIDTICVGLRLDKHDIID